MPCSDRKHVNWVVLGLGDVWLVYWFIVLVLLMGFRSLGKWAGCTRRVAGYLFPRSLWPTCSRHCRPRVESEPHPAGRIKHTPLLAG